MKAVKKAKEFLETGAEIALTGQAGLLPIPADELHEPPPAKPVRPPRTRKPKEAEVHPSQKELGKEHRGY